MVLAFVHRCIQCTIFEYSPHLQGLIQWLSGESGQCDRAPAISFRVQDMEKEGYYFGCVLYKGQVIGVPNFEVICLNGTYGLVVCIHVL